MSLTEIVNEIYNNEDFWKIFPKISALNTKLNIYGSLEDNIQHMFAETNTLFIKEKIKIYLPTEKIMFGTTKKEYYIGASNGRFFYFPADDKIVSDFLYTTTYFFHEIPFQKYLTTKSNNISEYTGFFNTIFDNKNIGDFVFDNLTEHGQEAYEKIYNEYIKYKFNKNIIIHKNIKIDIKNENPEIFSGHHPKQNLTISTYSKSLSFKYNQWVIDKYLKMHIPLIRNVTSIIDNPEFKNLKQKVVEEHFFDSYILHMNAPKILSTIDEIEKEYDENIKEYMAFLESVKSILTKYCILQKI